MIFLWTRCILFILAFVYNAQCKVSEWTHIFGQENVPSYTVFPNSMYKGANVDVQILCSSGSRTGIKQIQKVSVSWILQELECMEELYSTQTHIQIKDQVLSEVTYDKLQTMNSLPPSGHPHIRRNVVPRKDVFPNGSHVKKPSSVSDIMSSPNVHKFKFQVSSPQMYDCGQNNIITLKDESASPYYIGYLNTNISKDEPGRFSWTRQAQSWTTVSQTDGHVARVWENGMYHFLLNIAPVEGGSNFTARVYVKMKGDSGYLPAIQWPLLPVRGVLACLYLLIGSAWVLIWARSHQHTLKIHIVIGAVGVAAALANVLSFVELSAINSSGNGVMGLKWLSTFLAVLQGCLVNLVLMVVSTGYGITRPDLNRGLLATAMCLVSLTAVSTFLSYVVLDEDLKIKYNMPLVAMGVNIVYCIFMLVLGAWIMIYSILTFIHLGKREHSKRKMWSFTIFTVACIVVFVVNLALSVLGMGFTGMCARAWQLEWLLSSYSAMTSLVLLVVLMWLWRPVDEAQSYAFTPLNTDEMELVDGESDDDIELSVYDKVALEPMKT